MDVIERRATVKRFKALSYEHFRRSVQVLSVLTIIGVQWDLSYDASNAAQTHKAARTYPFFLTYVSFLATSGKEAFTPTF